MLAAPNTLVIAEATRRQIGRLFDLDDLGSQQLAGFAETQRIWRVVGESEKPARGLLGVPVRASATLRHAHAGFGLTGDCHSLT
jgi:hypothetical protein